MSKGDDAMSDTQRPPLEELLTMDAEAVRPWWRRMSMRERIRWAESGEHYWSSAASRLINERIPIDEDVPSDPEAIHAFNVADTPEVRRWLKRLRRLANEMPDGIFAVATDHGLNIYADPNGERELAKDLCIASVNGRWFGLPR